MKPTVIAALIVLLAVPALACDESTPGGKVFKKRCASCHKINGKGGKVGPELTLVGSQRDAAYIITKLKTPEATNADTLMPSFEDKLAADEFSAVVKCLTALR